MKNIPELSCAIVEDLLPTYVERLTSEETDMAVDARMAASCVVLKAATMLTTLRTTSSSVGIENTMRAGVRSHKLFAREGLPSASAAILPPIANA